MKILMELILLVLLHFPKFYLSSSSTTSSASSDDKLDMLNNLKDGKLDNKAKDHPKVAEFKKHSQKRPTKCQVCRVMVQEIQHELNKTNNSKEQISTSNGLDGRKTDHIPYKYSELRLLDVLEVVCSNVARYRAIAGPDFPYLRGVQSMYREELQKAIEVSGLTLRFDGPPDAVDDPTQEIRRMHIECLQMVEDYEEEIIEWFRKNQKVNPLDAICREHVLENKNDDCLEASTDIPEWGIKTRPQKENENLYNLLKQKTEL